MIDLKTLLACPCFAIAAKAVILVVLERSFRAKTLTHNNINIILFNYIPTTFIIYDLHCADANEINYT